MSRLPLILAIILILLTSGCDEIRDILDPERIEERLRDDPTRPGKVGAIVGVRVHQQAARHAKAMRLAADPGCEVVVNRGDRYVMHLDLERHRGTDLLSAWREHRTYSRDEEGHVALESKASFVTEIGGEGTRESRWRILGKDSFLGTATTTGTRWYRRDANEEEVRRAQSAGLGTLQALLDIVETWKADGGQWVYNPMGQPLRCSVIDEDTGWVDRFVARARLEQATLLGSPHRRELNATWALDDGSTITARLEDRVETFKEDIVPPDTTNVVDVLRDRSLARAVGLLEKLASTGIVEVASPPGTAEPESSDEP